MLPDPLIEGASCYNHGKFSSPSPREERAGRGMGRGVSSRMGLLSPTLSSCRGGEGADLLWPLGGCNKMCPNVRNPLLNPGSGNLVSNAAPDVCVHLWLLPNCKSRRVTALQEAEDLKSDWSAQQRLGRSKWAARLAEPSLAGFSPGGLLLVSRTTQPIGVTERGR